MNEAKSNCQFANWYPKLAKFVPRTRILEAPEEFREYLLSDGIALKEEQAGDSSESEWETPTVTEVENSSNGSDDDNDEIKEPPAEFHELIEATIKELNGEVAPKLNWSAPVDSTWMNTSNTMRCTSANDIYMLLKSSDYINHDLMQEPPKLTLVLREWFDLHPSTEFRCFVKDSRLVAITQRDMNYYEFLERAKGHIITVCSELASHIIAQFPNRDFVFDVHIPKEGEKAYLVDINPWDSQTDTLLFSWDELNDQNFPSVDQIEPEIRLVEKVDRTRTFSSKPHSTSHVPYDLVDMDRGSLEDVLRQMKAQRSNESSQKS